MTDAPNIKKLHPDRYGDGLTAAVLEPSRYDGQSDHPMEVAGVLHRMMPANVRVLDVGCGTGSVTLIANRGRGNIVVAIEPDVERAAIARSRGLDVYNGVLDEAFIARHDPFDVVMSSDVLEHVPSPSELLVAMIAAVKPGGLILLSVPNVAHWSVRLNLLVGRFEYEPVGIMDSTHLRWFTESSLRSLLLRTELTVLEIAQTAGFTLPLYMRGPLGRIPRPIRNGLIEIGTRLSPRLFGVQHVVTVKTQS